MLSSLYTKVFALLNCKNRKTLQLAIKNNCEWRFSTHERPFKQNCTVKENEGLQIRDGEKDHIGLLDNNLIQ